MPDHVAKILITAIDDELAYGRYTPGTPDPTQGAADIFVTDWELIQGRLTVPDDPQQPATFRARLEEDLKRLEIGRTYKIVDGYYGWKAEPVLDRERVWTRRVFEPKDAIKTYYDGRREEIPGGWDHEHCEICYATISPKKQPEGYADQEDRWVCIRCYETYVQPRSLAFFTRLPD